MTYPTPGPYDAIDWSLRRMAAAPASERPPRMIVADEAHAQMVRERMKALDLEDQLGQIPMVTHEEHMIAAGQGGRSAA